MPKLKISEHKELIVLAMLGLGYVGGIVSFNHKQERNLEALIEYDNYLIDNNLLDCDSIMNGNNDIHEGKSLTDTPLGTFALVTNPNLLPGWSIQENANNNIRLRNLNRDTKCYKKLDSIRETIRETKKTSGLFKSKPIGNKNSDQAYDDKIGLQSLIAETLESLREAKRARELLKSKSIGNKNSDQAYDDKIGLQSLIAEDDDSNSNTSSFSNR